MFSSLGLFKKTQCPQQQCNLPNCLFTHDEISRADNLDDTRAIAYDPLSAGTIEPPPTKKRRLNAPSKEAEATIAERENNAKTPELNHVVNILAATKDGASPTSPRSQKMSQASGGEVAPMPPLITASRPISPPTKGRRIKEPSSQQERTTALLSEQLIPRTTSKDPVPFPQRMSILKKFHQQIEDNNSRFAKACTDKPRLTLTKQEMIKQALDEEHNAANASSSPDGYKNTLAQRLSFFRKMTLDAWEEFVRTEWRPMAKEKVKPSHIDHADTGLSQDQEIAILPHLRTPVEALEKYGYVTISPSKSDIKSTLAALESVGGWELCDRCGSRFQVFPGRNEDGLLTTRGSCTYHWARVQRKKGQMEPVHPCCSRASGSEGCTTAQTHVFKVTEPKRLSALLEFENTPQNANGQYKSPVTFDCEMAYTTHGMELIRLTALSWPGKMQLLDVLVRPYGEILDLNTRFSGVCADQFAKAIIYDATDSVQEREKEDGEIEALPLCKVESPAAARALLFDLLTPETPLIGHAIENDLNACRIIHPYIVDTALLFPHPRGLPIRYKLKDLANKYLQRQIQIDGEQGHDSKEDSSATGDLVRVKVAQKWKQLKTSGWKWEDQVLVALKSGP